MEIPLRQVLEDTLSITSSIIKRAVHSVPANLSRRDVKFFSKELTQALLWGLHRWTDRQTDRRVTYFLEPLEPIYNPIFQCVKPQQDLHLHPKSIPTTVITGNSIFLEKKPQTPSRQLLRKLWQVPQLARHTGFFALLSLIGLLVRQIFFKLGVVDLNLTWSK